MGARLTKARIKRIEAWVHIHGQSSFSRYCPACTIEGKPKPKPKRNFAFFYDDDDDFMDWGIPW